MEYEVKEGSGWNIKEITPLENFVCVHKEVRSEVYELVHCNRTKTLVEMRDLLLKKLEEMKKSLKQIGDEDKIVEIEEGFPKEIKKMLKR